MKTTMEPTPLTPAVFHILLSLATGEKHGYEIMRQVKRDTNGKVKMGNGTLYGSIKRMLNDKLIESTGHKLDSAIDDERRIYYKLTDFGQQTLHAEMQRYVEVVLLVQKRKLLPKLSAKATQ